MNIEFKKSFLKDIKKIKNENLKHSISECIAQVESSDSLADIKNFKKLKNYEVHYRIRIGDYRIGIKLEGDILYFVVFEHRKDIYKSFP